jgi:MFS family permease
VALTQGFRGRITAAGTDALQILVPPSSTVRPLSWACLITTIGNGMWYTCWALFFTRSIGLAPAQVGIGITLGGCLGLVAAPMFGHLSDHLGAREVLVGVTALRGITMLGFILVHSFWPFLLVACLSTMADRSNGPTRMAMIIGLSEGAERMDTLAYVRMVESAGFALGALSAAPILAIGTRGAFLTMVVINAATFFAYAIIITRLPHVPPTGNRADVDGKRYSQLVVLHDLPYVAVNVLAGLLAVNWAILSTAAPLWVSRNTHVGTWIVSVLVIINAGFIALFQRRVVRKGDKPVRAARTTLLSTVMFAAACVVFAASGSRGGLIAAAILIAAALIHVTGELLWVAGAWGLSIGLMPDHHHAMYQSVYGTGENAAVVFAPALMTLIVIGLGVTGWMILAGIFLVIGAATHAAAGWAVRTRENPAAVPVAGQN